MSSQKTSSSKLLTEVELELMGILWKIREGTVHEVIESLPKERKLAYTSVSTMLRILEQKKVLGSRKEGRGHIYFPRLNKDEYEATSLHHLVKKVFDGAPSGVVRRLIETDGLTEDDLRAIQELIANKLEKK